MASPSAWARAISDESTNITKGNTFQEATKVTLKEGCDTIYEGTIPADWCYGHVAHGGTLASLLTRTATEHISRKTSNDRWIPASSQYHFFAPTAYGTVLVDLRDIKSNKRTSTICARLWQKPDSEQELQLKLESTITFEDPASWKANPLPDLPTRFGARCGEVWDRTKGIETHPHETGQGLFYKFKPNMAYTFLPGTRYDPGQGQRHPTLGPSVIETWHRCEENSTINHLAFIADHLGPILMNFDQAQRFRQMTQSMSLDIVKEPPAGGWEWLFLRHEMVACHSGRFWIDVVMLDENKDIVAIARHQCAAKPFERYQKSSKL